MLWVNGIRCSIIQILYRINYLVGLVALTVAIAAAATRLWGTGVIDYGGGLGRLGWGVVERGLVDWDVGGGMGEGVNDMGLGRRGLVGEVGLGRRGLVGEVGGLVDRRRVERLVDRLVNVGHPVWSTCQLYNSRQIYM